MPPLESIDWEGLDPVTGAFSPSAAISVSGRLIVSGVSRISTESEEVSQQSAPGRVVSPEQRALPRSDAARDD
jgi:hypothetical protein